MPCAPASDTAAVACGAAVEAYRGIEVETEAPGDSWLMHTFLSRQSETGLMNHAKYFSPSPIVDKEALF